MTGDGTSATSLQPSSVHAPSGNTQPLLTMVTLYTMAEVTRIHDRDLYSFQDLLFQFISPGKRKAADTWIRHRDRQKTLPMVNRKIQVS